MDCEQLWQAIERERRTLADLLDILTDEEWDHPSLCDGWRIRDVVAHLTVVSRPPGAGAMLVEAVRARGNFHRLNHDLSVRLADRTSNAVLLADLRSRAASRKLPVVTNVRNVLPDILVHGQDIAIPLGRERAMPLAAARTGAERIWTMGWPFWARRRLAGFRLTATDIEWTAGSGADIAGPIDALLMLLTGRTATVPRLSGAGVAELTARLTAVAR